MEDYTEIAERLKVYFEKKYPYVVLDSVEFNRRIKFDNKETAHRYALRLSFSYPDKPSAMYDVPYQFSSNISFENAFKKATMLVDAYLKSLDVDTE